jgi:hypothetical protein
MKRFAFILLIALSQVVYGSSILIPMDDAQTNRLPVKSSVFRPQVVYLINGNN